MGSQNYLDALASERRHNANLLKTIFVVTGVAILGMYIAWAIPKQIDLHISPDLRAGDVVSVRNGMAAMPSPNVYSFAYYVWQQINRWQADGGKDYGTQIYNFQSYLTPSCQAQLLGDMENRSRQGELSMRTRQVTELPGFGYQEARVIADGNSAWTVLLDMQVMETFKGQSIKDTFIRYPMRVVRYDVDRERNPFRLALDCFGANRPARIDAKDMETRNLANSSITPAALPRVGDAPKTAPAAAPAPETPAQAQQ